MNKAEQHIQNEYRFNTKIYKLVRGSKDVLLHQLAFGKVEPRERVLIIADSSEVRRNITEAFKMAVQELNGRPEVVYLPDPHQMVNDLLIYTTEKAACRGIEPMLLKDKINEGYSIFLNVFERRPAETKMREEIVDLEIKTGARVGNGPGLTESMLAKNADFPAIKKRLVVVTEKLEKAAIANIASPNGTNLKMLISGRHILNDVEIPPGDYGNICNAAEAWIAPHENKSEGVLIIDGSVGDGMGFVPAPLKIEIENGRIAIDEKGKLKIRWKNPYAPPSHCEHFLEDFIKHVSVDNGANVVCELGIGLTKGELTGNLSEDKKVEGIHIAFGDNGHMGGKNKSKTHISCIIKSAYLIVDYIDRRKQPEYVVDDGCVLIEKDRAIDIRRVNLEEILRDLDTLEGKIPDPRDDDPTLACKARERLLKQLSKRSKILAEQKRLPPLRAINFVEVDCSMWVKFDERAFEIASEITRQSGVDIVYVMDDRVKDYLNGTVDFREEKKAKENNFNASGYSRWQWLGVAEACEYGLGHGTIDGDMALIAQTYWANDKDPEIALKKQIRMLLHENGHNWELYHDPPQQWGYTHDNKTCVMAAHVPDPEDMPICYCEGCLKYLDPFIKKKR